MLRRIAWAALLIFCALVLAQETNLGSLVFGAECTERCPDDTDSGRCPPGCATCACISHGPPLSFGLALEVPLPAHSSPLEFIPQKQGAGPREDAIFHVPKPLLI